MSTAARVERNPVTLAPRVTPLWSAMSESTAQALDSPAVGT